MTPEELDDLANNLRLAYYGTLELVLPWEYCSVSTKEIWLRVAEEAIKWLVG